MGDNIMEFHDKYPWNYLSPEIVYLSKFAEFKGKLKIFESNNKILIPVSTLHYVIFNSLYQSVCTLFLKRNAAFWKLPFFWRREYTSESGVVHHFDNMADIEVY